MFGKRNRDEAGVTLVATNCELVGDIPVSYTHLTLPTNREV